MTARLRVLFIATRYGGSGVAASGEKREGLGKIWGSAPILCDHG
jgi:hypothetical protein